MKKASQAIPNKLLIYERLQHRWSQKELAERVGTTQINVSRWERGITSPSTYFRHQLCMLFDKNEEELGLVPLRNPGGDEPSTDLPEPEQTSPTPLSSFPQIWHVPFQRNPLFTGRDDILLSINHIFHSVPNAALRYECVLSGLGGVGKTQIALEYVYRYRQNYQAILWIDASTDETLAASTAAIATLLHSSEKDGLQPTSPIEEIEDWLQTYTNWLVVLDNVEDIEVISPILSTTHNNRILLTTRTRITGMIASHIDIDGMEEEEGKLFLLRRTRYIDLRASLDGAPESLCIQARDIVEAVDGFPLALDQAGAYIEETGCSLSGYLSLYQTQDATLLRRRGRVSAGHPQSVTDTLLYAIEKLEDANAVAAGLLCIFAFLDSSTIPEEIIVEDYASGTYDPLTFDAAIAELRKFSLIERNSHAKTLAIHPLTQVILRERYAQTEPLCQPTLSIGEHSPGSNRSGTLPESNNGSHPYFAQEKGGDRASSIQRHDLPSRNLHQRSLLSISVDLSSKQGRLFITPKIAIVLLTILIVLSSLLTVFYLLVDTDKHQTSPNSMAEEMKLEAQYFQKEGIGLSDGDFIFDTYAGRMDVNLKSMAALCLQQGDTSCAVDSMTRAISTDVTDGEIQIYNENLHVLQSGAPSVSIVLGLAIASDATYLLRARSIMQAAFLAQHEINTKGLLPGNRRLRILIDNSGADDARVATAAQFIANRIRNGNPDHIVAVVGWPSSSETVNALDVVTGVRVPMISQTASSTSLSGGSPYFFRVNPTDAQQGETLGDVAVKQFQAKRILLLQDPTDPYSVSLANAFSNRVMALKASVIHGPGDNFTLRTTTSDAYQRGVVKEAVEKKVDLIFMAGFDVDAVRLAHALGNAYRAKLDSAFLANLKIMRGDAAATGLLLGIGGGPDASIAVHFPQDMRRLMFSSFAYPDEWTFERIPSAQQPHFFSDWFTIYKNISVDATDVPQPGSHAILTYDAIQVLVKAMTLVKHSLLTGETIRAALASLGTEEIPPFQGISGLIAFNNQGDPIDKAFVLLDIESVGGSNRFVLKQVIGPLHK